MSRRRWADQVMSVFETEYEAMYLAARQVLPQGDARAACLSAFQRMIGTFSGNGENPSLDHHSLRRAVHAQLHTVLRSRHAPRLIARSTSRPTPQGYKPDGTTGKDPHHD